MMGGGGMMGNWGVYGLWGTGYGWLDVILNLVINLVVIVGVVLLLAWFIRRIFPAHEIAGGRGGSLVTAKEILQARYARGEITREQYKKMILDLS